MRVPLASVGVNAAVYAEPRLGCVPRSACSHEIEHGLVERANKRDNVFREIIAPTARASQIQLQ